MDERPLIWGKYFFYKKLSSQKYVQLYHIVIDSCTYLSLILGKTMRFESCDKSNRRIVLQSINHKMQSRRINIWLKKDFWPQCSECFPIAKYNSFTYKSACSLNKLFTLNEL